MNQSLSGLQWIQFANAREIGQVEFRQVELEIGAGISARGLQITTLRQVKGSIAQTVFCAMEPRAFRNINYVVVEHRGKIEPFEIQLYLPYVKGTLRKLSSEKRRESLIGSDFAYDDLRTWLYEEEHQYDYVENDSPLVKIKGNCVNKCELIRSGNQPFDVWIDPNSGFVHGIDYWSSNRDKIIRKYRAEDIGVVDDILIAHKMTMVDCLRDRSTIIRLERAWYNHPIDPIVFEVSFRKETYSYLANL